MVEGFRNVGRTRGRSLLIMVSKPLPEDPEEEVPQNQKSKKTFLRRKATEEYKLQKKSYRINFKE